MAIVDNLNNPNVLEEANDPTMRWLGWGFLVVCVSLIIWGVSIDPTVSTGFDRDTYRMGERVFNLQAGLYKLIILLGGMASGVAGLLLLIGDVIVGTLHRGGKPPVKELRSWEKEEFVPDDEENEADRKESAAQIQEQLKSII